jgi:predicted negative regulator of RcsB-dependent stress response
MSDLSPKKTPVSDPGSGTPAGKSWFELPTEEQLQDFWVKNRNAIYIVGAVAILAIVGRGVYDELAARREAGIEATFSAATTPAKLQAFVRENSRHPLAGAAYLQLADEAYAGARFAEAQGFYQKVVEVLPGTPFAGRATLGQAVCLLQSGKPAEGIAMLQQLAGDANQLQAVRSEAAFHLASLAFAGGKYDDVTKFTDLIMQIDANGVWAQRALLLRMRTPVSATAAPAQQPKGELKPTVSIKLPGS